jgi:hypothetical protein
VRHAIQPQPSVEPRKWPRIVPHTPQGDLVWEPTEPPEKEMDDTESQETPPMPRPAVRIEEWGHRSPGVGSGGRIA